MQILQKEKILTINTVAAASPNCELQEILEFGLIYSSRSNFRFVIMD